MEICLVNTGNWLLSSFLLLETKKSVPFFRDLEKVHSCVYILLQQQNQFILCVMVHVLLSIRFFKLLIDTLN